MACFRTGSGEEIGDVMVVVEDANVVLSEVILVSGDGLMVAVRSLIPVMAQYAGLVVVVMVMVESHNRWVAEESPDVMAHLVEEEMDDLGVDYSYLCLCVVVGFLMDNARVWVKEAVLYNVHVLVGVEMHMVMAVEVAEVVMKVEIVGKVEAVMKMEIVVKVEVEVEAVDLYNYDSLEVVGRWLSAVEVGEACGADNRELMRAVVAVAAKHNCNDSLEATAPPYHV